MASRRSKRALRFNLITKTSQLPNVLINIFNKKLREKKNSEAEENRKEETLEQKKQNSANEADGGGGEEGGTKTLSML